MDACQSVSKKVDNLACVLGATDTDCYKKIALKQADVGMFDGGDIYHAGRSLAELSPCLNYLISMIFICCLLVLSYSRSLVSTH